MSGDLEASVSPNPKRRPDLLQQKTKWVEKAILQVITRILKASHALAKAKA